METAVFGVGNTQRHAPYPDPPGTFRQETLADPTDPRPRSVRPPLPCPPGEKTRAPAPARRRGPILRFLTGPDAGRRAPRSARTGARPRTAPGGDPRGPVAPARTVPSPTRRPTPAASHRRAPPHSARRCFGDPGRRPAPPRPPERVERSDRTGRSPAAPLRPPAPHTLRPPGPRRGGAPGRPRPPAHARTAAPHGPAPHRIGPRTPAVRGRAGPPRRRAGRPPTR